jgi:hypothetical protein
VDNYCAAGNSGDQSAPLQEAKHFVDQVCDGCEAGQGLEFAFGQSAIKAINILEHATAVDESTFGHCKQLTTV